LLPEGADLTPCVRRGLAFAPRFALNEALVLLHEAHWSHSKRLLDWMCSLAARSGERPNEHSYAAFLAGCGPGPSLDAARLLWQELTQGGVLPSERVCRAILGVLGRAGENEEAVALLQRMSWEEGGLFSTACANIVIAACAQSRSWDAARRAWELLCDSEAQPGAYTLSLLLRAADRGCAWREGLAAASCEAAERVVLDAAAAGSLLSVAGKAGDSVAARAAWARLRALPIPLTTQLCNCYLAALAWDGDCGRVEEVLELMAAQRIRRDVRSHTAAMEAARRDSRGAPNPDERLVGVRAALARLLAEGLSPTAVTLNVLLTALGDAGRWEEARRTAAAWQDEHGVELNVRIYNSVIRAAGRAGEGEAALAVFKEMQAAGVLPSRVTFALLFASLSPAQREASAELRLLRDSLEELGMQRDEVEEAREMEEPTAPEDSFAPGAMPSWALEEARSRRLQPREARGVER